MHLQPISERPNLVIKECKLDSSWDVGLIQRLVGEDRTTEIMKVLSNCQNGVDCLIWMESVDGKFSTKSAWDCIQIRAPNNKWIDWVWHSYLSKTCRCRFGRWS